MSSLQAGQYVDFSYTDNGNGTFDITVEATYYRFLNYSMISSSVKSEITTARVTLKNQKKFPTTVKLGGGATLKLKNGIYTLSYSKNQKVSKNNKNEFRTTVNYRKST